MGRIEGMSFTEFPLHQNSGLGCVFPSSTFAGFPREPSPALTLSISITYLIEGGARDEFRNLGLERLNKQAGGLSARPSLLV